MRIHWCGAILVAASLALSAGVQAQTRGGAATLGVEQDIAGFDPLIVGVYDTGQIAVAALVFDTLTRIDDAGKLVPAAGAFRGPCRTI
jgi:4-phytase/acid phosphatase/peptide/nickel transport system substrate-binding protein